MADRTVTYRFKGDISDLSAKMMAAGRQVEGLDDRLDRFDNTTVRTNNDTAKLGKGLDGLGASSSRNGKAIDKMSGRLRLIGEAATVIGPALIPLGAGMIPVVTGLASGMGALAGAAGVTMLAFNGVGDSLKALNEYQADPTVENLKKMNAEFKKLGPSGTQFVKTLDSFSPELEKLQRTAGKGIFPGFESGLKSVMTLMPQVRTIVKDISETVGRLGSDAGRSLAQDSDWQAFFDYLKTDAAPTLDKFGRSIGNFAAGAANMLRAFAPLSRDFSSGMLEMSRSFRKWTAGLGDNTSFQKFINYIRQSAPQAKAFMGALANAVVDLAVAFAPWGSTVLPVLTGVLKAFSAIARSPIGPTLATAAASMMLLGRATKLVNMSSFLSGLSGATGGLSRFSKVARGAAGIGGMMLLTSGATKAKGAMGTLATVASSAAIGFSVAGPWGAAIGGGVGLLGKLTGAFGDSEGAAREQARELAKTKSAEMQAAAVDSLKGSLNQLTGAYTGATDAAIYNNLQTAGAIDDANKLGISTRTLVQAAKGDPKAISWLQDYSRNLDTASGHTAEMESLLGKVGIESKNLDKAQKGVRDLARATESATKILGITKKEFQTFPKDLKTHLQVVGVPKSKKEVAELDKQVGKMDRKTATMILKAAGIKPTKQAINELIDRGEKLDKQRPKPKMSLDDKAFFATLGGVARSLREANNKKATPNINAKDNASPVIGRVISGLSNIVSKQVTITTVHRTVRTAAGITAAAARAAAGANGMMFQGGVQTFASGGLDRPNAHQPNIFAGGPIRVFAEPETKGEAYIPLANDGRRPRAKSIAEQTVALLGGDVAWFANGGTAQASQTSTSTAVMTAPRASRRGRRPAWDGRLSFRLDDGYTLEGYVAEIASGVVDAADLMAAEIDRADWEN